MHSIRWITAHAFAGLLIAAGPACAWGQSAAAGDTNPVVRANADLVLLDVVVTDHGTPVHGLDRSKFHVFEDGRAETIATFDEHRPATGSTVALVRQALPPHTYSNVPIYPAGSSVNVLLLDGLNTPLANQMDVRRKMIQYLGKIAPGTSLAIFTLSSRLRLVEGFTTDAARLSEVLKSRKGTPQPSVVLDPESDQALDSTLGEMANMTAGADTETVAWESALSAMQQFEADQIAFQTDARVQMTLAAMQQLARYLAGIPGRKNLIWFSGSFPIALDPDATKVNSFEAMRNYPEEIRNTAELLAAARVAVYPVDARGLATPASADASYSRSSNLVGATLNGGRGGTRRSAIANKPLPALDDVNAQKQLMAEEASMKQIAEQTGGEEYVNTNGLEEAVASAVENGSSYYTIGFVPGTGQFDGQFRKLEVRLDGGDVNLAYRHGYYADAPDKPTEHTPGQTSLIMAATLHGAPASTQILFEARVLGANDPAFKGVSLPGGPGGELTAQLKVPLHRMMTDLKIDAHTLRFERTPDGALHDKVEFALVAFDGDGKRVNYLDTGLQLSLKAGEGAQVMKDGIRIRLPLELPAGRLWLRIAVHDLDAGRAGSLEVPVLVTAQ